MERVKKQTKRLSKSVHPRNIPSARMGLSPTTPIDATTRECCFPDCAGPSTAMAVPLPNSTSHVTMSPATPEKPARIGRKSMSRRSGQSGSIQKEGNWYVVRYWKDVAGQEKRQRVYERICPISGPGKPFSIRTGTQGQGDHRGQRSGHPGDRKSTRLNSSHGYISYAVFCLKKKKNRDMHNT